MPNYNINPNYPDNWEEIRKSVLERDSFKCCNNQNHSTQTLHVHHIVPISRGGTHHLSNLITLCDSCHRNVHPFMEDEKPKNSGIEHITLDIGSIPFKQDFKIRVELYNELTRKLKESPVEVQEALKDYHNGADEYQQIAINANRNTIRILAPAGSGKTQTIINRLFENIKNGMNSKRMLFLTFDNAAVSSVKRKFDDCASELSVSIESPDMKTLNSFGYNLLRERFSQEHKSIITERKRSYLFKELKERLQGKDSDIYNSLPSNIHNRYYIEFFSLLKNKRFDPRNIDAQKMADFMLTNPTAKPLFPNHQDRDLVKKVIQALIWLYMSYEALLQREKVMDFDDQKLDVIYYCRKIQQS